MPYMAPDAPLMPTISRLRGNFVVTLSSKEFPFKTGIFMDQGRTDLCTFHDQSRNMPSGPGATAHDAAGNRIRRGLRQADGRAARALYVLFRLVRLPRLSAAFTSFWQHPFSWPHPLI